MLDLKAKQLYNVRGHVAKYAMVITLPSAQYLVSYETIVVKRLNNGEVFIDGDTWTSCTRTTRKHICLYLQELSGDVREKVKSGEYTLAHLN